MEKMKNRQLREENQKAMGRPPPQQEIDLLKQISNQVPNNEFKDVLTFSLRTGDYLTFRYETGII